MKIEEKLNIAKENLLKAGFYLNEKSHTSLSEYYCFPNQTGQIRLSDHKSKQGGGKNKIKITPRINLTIKNTTKPTLIKESTAKAIGFFFIHSTYSDI